MAKFVLRRRKAPFIHSSHRRLVQGCIAGGAHHDGLRNLATGVDEHLDAHHAFNASTACGAGVLGLHCRHHARRCYRHATAFAGTCAITTAAASTATSTATIACGITGAARLIIARPRLGLSTGHRFFGDHLFCFGLQPFVDNIIDDDY